MGCGSSVEPIREQAPSKSQSQQKGLQPNHRQQSQQQQHSQSRTRGPQQQQQQQELPQQQHDQPPTQHPQQQQQQQEPLQKQYDQQEPQRTTSQPPLQRLLHVITNFLDSTVGNDAASTGAIRSSAASGPTAEITAQLVISNTSNVNQKPSFVSEQRARIPLLQWVRQLPAVEPSLGYTAEHVAQLVETARSIMSRQKAQIEAAAAGGSVVEWIETLGACDEPLELLLAGIWYTCDLVDSNNKSILVPPQHLAAHGVDHSTTRPHKLCLYYVMNAAMRAAGAVVTASNGAGSVFDASVPQRHVITVFQPLITALQRLIATLPKHTTTVFRGINVNVSRPYKVGTAVVWHAFTSTSLVSEAAEFFMGTSGTFFVIIAKEGAADVRFCSMYPEEEELLYNSNIEFVVGWKVSPSLLRMMGLSYDVIVMQEQAGSERSREDRHTALRLVLSHTAKMFEIFLSGYIEARLRSTETGDEQKVLSTVDSWLDGAKPRPPLGLVGPGGTGKTSAAVATMAHLAKRNNGTYPVFIPLAAVQGDLLEEPAIDRYVLASLGFTSQQHLEELSDAFDVVLVLDSVDESSLTAAALAAKKKSLLAANPWAASSCSVVFSARDEYFTAERLLPTILFPGCTTWEVQAFDEGDAEAYVEKQVERHLADQLETRLKEAGISLLEVDSWKKVSARAADLQDAQRREVLEKAGYEVCNSTDEVATVSLRDGEKAREALCRRVHKAAGAQRNAVNPLMLRMVVEGTLAGHDCSRDVFESFLQCHLRKKFGDTESDREKALHIGERVACRMLAVNRWQDQLSAFADGQDDEFLTALEALPVRIEDVGDAQSLFGFQHKLFAEYLVARRLAREPAETLVEFFGDAPWSQRAPEVLRHFRTIWRRPSEALCNLLLPIIRDHHTTCPSLAANAAAVMCAVGAVPSANLSGVTLRHVDMRYTTFSNVSFAASKFEDVWLDGAEFWRCDFDGAEWDGASFSEAAPPAQHHGDFVVGMVVLNNRVASGGTDMQIKVWDIKQQEPDVLLQAEVEYLTATTDAKFLIARVKDGRVVVWDTVTWKKVKKVPAPTKWVVTVPGTHMLVTGYSVHDLDGDEAKTLQHDEDAFLLESWAGVSPDAAYIVASGREGWKRCRTTAWSASTLQAVHTEEICLEAAAFVPDGTKLVGVEDYGEVQIRTVPELRKVGSLPGSSLSHHQQALAVTLDGLFVVLYNRRCIEIWSLVSGRQVRSIDHKYDLCALLVAPDGDNIISSDRTGMVMVEPLQKTETTEPGNMGRLRCAATSHSVSGGFSLLTGEEYGQGARVFELQGNTEVGQLDFTGNEGIEAAAGSLASSSPVIAAGGRWGTIVVWDVPERREAVRWTIKEESRTFVTAMTFTPDASRLLIGWSNGRVQVWKWKTQELIEIITVMYNVRNTEVDVLAADNTHLVTQSAPGKLLVHDFVADDKIQEVEILWEGRVSLESLSCIVLDGDSTLVALSSFYAALQIRSFPSCELVWEAAEGVYGAVDMAFIANATRLVAITKDGTLAQYDVANRQFLSEVPTYNSTGRGLAVGPDGEHVATVGSNGVIRVWSVADGRSVFCTQRIGTATCDEPDPWCYDCTSLDTIKPQSVKNLLIHHKNNE